MATKKKESAPMFRYILWGAGIGAAGFLGYQGYRYLQAQQQGRGNSGMISIADQQGALTQGGEQQVTQPQLQQPWAPGSFPLRRGMRGELVKQLQTALRKVNDQARQEIDSSGGVDNFFGSGTERALMAAGYPTTVSQANFMQLTGQVSATGNRQQSANPQDFSRFQDLISELHRELNSNFIQDELIRNVFQNLAGRDLKEFVLAYDSVHPDEPLLAELEKVDRGWFSNLTDIISKIKTANALNGMGARLVTMYPTTARRLSDGAVLDIPANADIGTEQGVQDGKVLFVSHNGQRGIIDANAVATA